MRLEEALRGGDKERHKKIVDDAIEEAAKLLAEEENPWWNSKNGGGLIRGQREKRSRDAFRISLKEFMEEQKGLSEMLWSFHTSKEAGEALKKYFEQQKNREDSERERAA